MQRVLAEQMAVFGDVDGAGGLGWGGSSPVDGWSSYVKHPSWSTVTTPLGPCDLSTSIRGNLDILGFWFPSCDCSTLRSCKYLYIFFLYEISCFLHRYSNECNVL